MSMTRRDFSRTAAILMAGLTQLRPSGATAAQTASEADHMAAMPAGWVGAEQITMVVYPGMTALDVVGPQYAFAGLMGATVRLVSRDGKPFVSDTGLSMTPDGSFAGSPEAPDILFVGGGLSGTLTAMQDTETLDYLASRGAKAGLVTSACTGSLLLGAAGLLDGYQATSHWAARGGLADFGARPVDRRVVSDRNRITAAGISAGIDLGLVVAEKLRGPLYAQCLQLGMEYAPEPPFNAGTPATAPVEAVSIMDSMYADFRNNVTALAKTRRH